MHKASRAIIPVIQHLKVAAAGEYKGVLTAGSHLVVIRLSEAMNVLPGLCCL